MDCTYIPLSLPSDGIPSKAIARDIIGTFLTEWADIDPESLSLSYRTGRLDAHCIVEQRTALGSAASSTITKVFIRLHRDPEAEMEILKPLVPSKEAEAQLCHRFGQLGYGPRMLGFFQLQNGQKGRIDSFVDSRTLEPEDVQDEEIRADIAKAHAVLHNLEDTGSLAKAVDQYYEAVINGLKTYHKMDKLKDLARQGGVNMDDLFDYDVASRLHRVADALKSTRAKKGWCMHDVQYLNVLVRRHPRQGECKVVLIDFEFVFQNYRAFDVGGHFSQKLFKWSDEESKVADCRAYGEEEKKHFCEMYARRWNEITGDSDTWEVVYEEAKLGYLASLTIYIYSQMLVMNLTDNKNPLDLKVLKKLFEEFIAQYEELGFEN